MDAAEVSLFLSITACLFYVMTIAVLLRGMRTSVSTAATPGHSFVSVIVAARNEEHNIQRLLTALTRQTYDRCEIIIVDDRSEDRTANLVREFSRGKTPVKLVSITDLSGDMPPKKQALAAGIRESRGDILLFTDADCAPSPGWVAAMAGTFSDRTGVVCGYSPYDPGLRSSTPRTLTGRIADAFLRFEELKGALWSAGSIGIGRAWLATGRNLAYRRAVWDEVDGFDKIRHSISGDDDLFLQLVRQTTSWEIRYASVPASVVPTAPPDSFRAFVAQRTRHFSAGRYFSIPMKAFLTAFHLSNYVLYIALGMFIAGMFPTGIILYAVKSTADLAFVHLGRLRLGISTPVSSVLLLEFLYALYNAVFGPLGTFGSFTWKGSGSR